ncbi:MAG: fumarylacetoacetate hydrolase family protein [Calditrichaceae bacterium]
MKLFKTKNCIIIQKDNNYYPVNEIWDSFVNDDHLFDKMERITKENNPIGNGQDLIDTGLEAPIGLQELWASGVTYMRSKQGRQEESKKAGGGDFYQHVYEAERPELFFKANANRVVGHGEKVRIRRDSTWNVPEPELTLLITSNEKIVGYTVGNDMSSRSIEGENPLYLPQAKTYDACAALGPCIYVTKEPLPSNTLIDLKIKRVSKVVFTGDVEINQIKRSFEELASFLYRECTFPYGSMLMTGTGIVPTSEFTLQTGDEISIIIDNIGTLVNEVE